MGKANATDNSVCRNRKATFRFDILEELECGIVLEGAEVKSLREKAASLEESYARIDNHELWLIGMHITPYKFSSKAMGDPTRKRKLLVRAAEIRKLKPKVEQKGLTLVPLWVYFNERGIAKVRLAVAKGKSARDKRQSLRAREDKREMARAMRGKN
jgi:SsrA-binding protein